MKWILFPFKISNLFLFSLHFLHCFYLLYNPIILNLLGVPIGIRSRLFDGQTHPVRHLWSGCRHCHDECSSGTPSHAGGGFQQFHLNLWNTTNQPPKIVQPHEQFKHNLSKHNDLIVHSVSIVDARQTSHSQVLSLYFPNHYLSTHHKPNPFAPSFSPTTLYRSLFALPNTTYSSGGLSNPPSPSLAPRLLYLSSTRTTPSPTTINSTPTYLSRETASSSLFFPHPHSPFQSLPQSFHVIPSITPLSSHHTPAITPTPISPTL